MASTYSDRLKLELMEAGANSGVWGNNTNENLEVVDAAIGGYLSKSVAGSANVTLTTANRDPNVETTNESANKVIEFTGALTGDIYVFVPAVEKEYIFFNNTTGSQTLTVAPTGHAANGVAITQGAHTIMYNKSGTGMVDLFANSLGTLSVKGNANIVGTTTFNDNVSVSSGKSITVNSAITLNANGVVDATSFTGNGAGLTGVDPFESGTKMVFYQASAPTGWTQDTAAALSNTALSVVTGTGGGTGGSDSFYSTFGASRTLNTGAIPVTGSLSGSVGGTTLSTPTIASHSHSMIVRGAANANNNGFMSGLSSNTGGRYSGNFTPDDNTNNAGGGGSHSHPFSGSLSGASTANTPLSIPAMNIKYANVIVASKD
jgi:hypothetical protein